MYYHIIDSKINAQNANNFICIFCDCKCRKKSDWERHLNTSKHKMIVNDSKNYTDDIFELQISHYSNTSSLTQEGSFAFGERIPLILRLISGKGI